MLNATTANEAVMVIRWRLCRCLRILDVVIKKQCPGGSMMIAPKVNAGQPPFTIMQTAFLLQPLLSEFDTAGI